MTNPIHPCLWFDSKARAAAEFYCSVFANSRITSDTPVVVNFELYGQKFMALNGGPMFTINPSVSFFVICESEVETDSVWNKLMDGGQALMPLGKYEWSDKYGWCQDRFGVSWQVAYGKLSDVGQRITPSLLFVGQQHGKAGEAIDFYMSIFPNSSVTGVLKYGIEEEEPEGTVKHAQFTINNYVVMAMDSAGPHAFSFNEAVSLVVACKDQQEIDYYWQQLTDGGEESKCGWLKDRFGISWQIVPAQLGIWMSEPGRARRITDAFLKMTKMDIEKLENA